jgi:hypothetical protein
VRLSVNLLDSEAVRWGRVIHLVGFAFGLACLGVLAWLAGYCLPLALSPSTPPAVWVPALAELPVAALAALGVLHFLLDQGLRALRAWVSPCTYLLRCGKW